MKLFTQERLLEIERVVKVKVQSFSSFISDKKYFLNFSQL